MSSTKNTLRVVINIDLNAWPELSYLASMEHRGHRGFEAVRLLALGKEYEQILKEESKARRISAKAQVERAPNTPSVSMQPEVTPQPEIAPAPSQPVPAEPKTEAKPTPHATPETAAPTQKTQSSIESDSEKGKIDSPKPLEPTTSHAEKTGPSKLDTVSSAQKMIRNFLHDPNETN